MKPKTIAITGCIGSGKSTVAKILVEEYSFDVIDCDQLAREVANDSAVLAQISLLLGTECVTDGKLNRRKVREIVFSDAELHKKYSAVFFERVKSLLMQRVKGLAIAFVEIPVLDAFLWDWQEIWFVESPRESCVKRVVLRDGVSEGNVFDILARQQSFENFTRKIVNDGTLDDLRAQVNVALLDAKLL